MMTVAFDTLKLATKLEEAGFTPAQAKGASSAIADALTGEIATKNDLDRVETSLKTDLDRVETSLKTEIVSLDSKIEKVEASLKSDIELTKRDLKIWFGSVLVAAVGILIAAIRYLPVAH